MANPRTMGENGHSRSEGRAGPDGHVSVTPFPTWPLVSSSVRKPLRLSTHPGRGEGRPLRTSASSGVNTVCFIYFASNEASAIRTRHIYSFHGNQGHCERKNSGPKSKPKWERAKSPLLFYPRGPRNLHLNPHTPSPPSDLPTYLHTPLCIHTAQPQQLQP